jgi:hypothetical protein
MHISEMPEDKVDYKWWMADIYIYADETGNLDYSPAGISRASSYFGFGTAIFTGHHGEELWRGLALRSRVERGDGHGHVTIRNGFHAVRDSNRTRAEMFNEIANQSPRVDATLLLKRNAFPEVVRKGEMYLYKLAWYLHFQALAPCVSEPGDHLFVIVATLGTKKRQTQARKALHEVCTQMNRDFTLCTWDAGTSWGLQVADYALWSIQRRQEGSPGTWWHDYVKNHTHHVNFPWGDDQQHPWGEKKKRSAIPLEKEDVPWTSCH